MKYVVKTNDQLVSSQDSPKTLETNGRSHVTSGARCTADRSALTKSAPDIVYNPQIYINDRGIINEIVKFWLAKVPDTLNSSFSFQLYVEKMISLKLSAHQISPMEI